MVRQSVEPQQKTGEPASAARPFSIEDRLREISMFFDGTDRVHETMRHVAEIFRQNNIPYAIVGGMAVNAHKHVRTTGDVDFLIRAESLQEIRKLAAQGVFKLHPTRSRRFTDPTTDIAFDVLITGMFPGSGRPIPVAFPDPLSVSENRGTLSYINLKSLIELKLAAHRYQDFADVVNLIAANDLNESYLSQLHPSVHKDFIECLEEKRREDEYEARADREADEISGK